MTTLDESTIVAQPTLEPSENDTVRRGAQAWQLGILTDRAGHVHLGAVVAGTGSEPYSYIDLLTPLGADSAGELDLKQLVVLVHGKELADLRRLAERCIDDARLRQQLVQLADLAGIEMKNSIAEPPLERGRRCSCVVCGRRTSEMVRPMGVLTEPIWCCHSHDDRTIFRAWIHSLPEWQRLQAESPSNCTECNSPCHCDAEESVGHRCACWPPSLDHAAGATTS